MKLERKYLEEIIFGRTGFRRFLQDSPVLPDVWMAFGENPQAQLDLLLTPIWGKSPGKISNIIARRLEAEQKTTRWKAIHENHKSSSAEIAYNVSTVAVKLTFDEMIRVILPMTSWWENYILKDAQNTLSKLINNKEFRDSLIESLKASIKTPDKNPNWDIIRSSNHSTWGETKPKLNPHLIWLIKLVGTILLNKPVEETFTPLTEVAAIIDAFVDLMKGIENAEGDEEKELVWSINLNRPATAMIWRSTNAVKADAARRLFEVNCEDIRWAIIDSGIDATHPAFRIRGIDKKISENAFINDEGKPENMTRIVKTYDFTFIREILSRDYDPPENIKKDFGAKEKKILQERLIEGRAIDWCILLPLIEIPHIEGKYEQPVFEHGTHVAGILGADWKADDTTNEKNIDIRGICPNIRLYDLRVLDENGESDEFSILAALQFVQYLNANSDHQLLHGVNLSLSIRNNVRNFGCGCTPVCEEAERLTKSGLVVVAAAGNDGYIESDLSDGSFSEGYKSISITDPGNAEGVITVGSTHRDSPHTYGVSYFSSRGPTGDGRIKPDLVAPGEKITSLIPNNGLKMMDGTSMAAPHVSGAAALLIARYSELIGKPDRVKKILCSTATDLGRERYFQGSGMLDILRAMQSV